MPKEETVMAQAIRKAYVKQIQHMPPNSLTEAEIAEKILLMYGHAVKKCSICATWKKLAAFPVKLEETLFNFKNVCSDCIAKEKITNILKNKPIVKIAPVIEDIKEIPMQETKTCTICKKTKPLLEFSKHKLGKLGKHTQCNVCKEERKGITKDKKKQKPVFNKVVLFPATPAPVTPPVSVPVTKRKRGKTSITPEYKQKHPGVYLFTEQLKFCPLCKTMKMKEEFHVDRQSPSGCFMWCKDCSKKRREGIKVKPENKGTQEQLKEVFKTCNICDRPLPLSEFYAASSGGLRGECKTCTKEANNQRHRDKKIIEAAPVPVPVKEQKRRLPLVYRKVDMPSHLL